MIGEIDWNGLEPYSGNCWKSFQQLCYQIVFEEYKTEIEKGAVLTPFDDSGGGDGIEFFLTQPKHQMGQ